MKKIAILASSNLLPGTASPRADCFELEEEMEKLTSVFAAHKVQLDLLPWEGFSEIASQYDAVMPLFVWDYFEGKQPAFTSEMARTAQLTNLLNPYEVLVWNSDKAYLNELKRAGAPVIDMVELNRVTQVGVQKAMEDLGSEKVVVKPRIGGGAWRQFLYEKGAPFPDKDDLPPAEAIVQAYLPSVVTEGEYSFLYFGGSFSHAVRKLPASGDYRIQSIYGGSEETYIPGAQERSIGQSILDGLDFTPLYARVDLLRDRDGHLKLIELELIEPYLYLTHAQGQGAENKGAQKLAESLVRRLGRKRVA